MIVVIPSIRNINLEYIEPLLNKGNKIIVVDDTDEERIQVTAKEVMVFHYSDRKRILGPLEKCVPIKNGVCRDLGLLIAYHIASDDDTIVCLDDDCQVFDEYQSVAESSLGLKNLLEIQTKHRFYNPLDLYDMDSIIFPRGFPYEERVATYDYKYRKSINKNVVFNLGLWHGVFDVNAIDKLYLDKFSFDDVDLKYDQVVVQPGPILSLCSMNMIMKREVIPAIYQLPMNEPIVPNWKIDRYGDIWGGYICKMLIDIKGDALSVGKPLIYHHKDSNLHKNIMQEHYSHIVNLQFCDLIELACRNIKPGSYLDMYGQLVNNLKSLESSYPAALANYILPTVKKIDMWVKALSLPHIELEII